MRILNSILRSNALLRSALERSWGFLRGSSIRASLQQQRNKRAILVKVILANLKAHKFLTKFSIKNWLDLSRRQFDFYFQKVCFLVSCDSKISVGIKDSFPLIPNLFKSLYNITISKWHETCFVQIFFQIIKSNKFSNLIVAVYGEVGSFEQILRWRKN